MAQTATDTLDIVQFYHLQVQVFNAAIFTARCTGPEMQFFIRIIEDVKKAVRKK